MTTPKRRGRPPKKGTPTPKKPAPTSRKPIVRKKKTSALKLTDLDWIEVQPNEQIKGYRTETDSFIGTLSVMVYNFKTLYFAIDVRPKPGYQLAAPLNLKWFNTLKEAQEAFLQCINSIQDNNLVANNFPRMWSELRELINPT